MKKTVRLTEKDLSRITKRIIKEDINLDDYTERYDDLGFRLNDLIYQLNELSRDYEELAEEVYSQIDTFDEEESEEVDYDKEQYYYELENIANGSFSYSQLIDKSLNILD